MESGRLRDKRVRRRGKDEGEVARFNEKKIIYIRQFQRLRSYELESMARIKVKEL